MNEQENSELWIKATRLHETCDRNHCRCNKKNKVLPGFIGKKEEKNDDSTGH